MRQAAASLPLLVLLVLISMLGPFSLNVLMPSLPGLAQVFSASRDQVQLALSLFIVGMAFSQLFSGPLADRFGRRPVLVAAIGLYLAASAAAVFAGSIGALVADRVAQALGATAGVTLARAVIRDLYARNEAAAMIGYITMGMMIAPLIAPSLGGVLDERFGWQAIFYACGVLGVAALIATLAFLPETRPVGAADASTAEVLRRAKDLLRRRAFLSYIGVASFASAMFFTFVGAAPYLMIDVMGLAKSAYGLWFILTAFGYIVGNFIAARLSQRIGSDRMILAGNLLGLAGTILGVATALALPAHPAVLFVPATLMTLSNGLVLPNAIAGAVSVDPNAAGAASGIIGFSQMAVGAAASFAAAKVAHAIPPVALGMLAWAVLALLAARIGRRPRSP